MFNKQASHLQQGEGNSSRLFLIITTEYSINVVIQGCFDESRTWLASQNMVVMVGAGVAITVQVGTGCSTITLTLILPCSGDERGTHPVSVPGHG